MLYFGRLIVGMGISFSSTADIPYLTEMSPISKRGIITSFYEMMLVIGIFFAFIINKIFSDDDWRWMFWVSVLMALAQSILLLFLPESPRWLYVNNQKRKAFEVLKKVHPNSETVDLVWSEMGEGQNERFSVTSWSELGFWKFPLLVVIIILFFAFFTGGIVVRNFAPKVFEDAKMSNDSSETFLIVLGAIKVVVTAVAICVVDKFGRKPLLLCGIALIGGGHVILGLSFGFDIVNVENYVIGCNFITFGYSIGFGPVQWLLQAEMFPTGIRGRAIGISQAIGNIFMFLSNFMFVPLVEHVGSTMVFAMFAFISFFGFIFVLIFLVETSVFEPDAIRIATNDKFKWFTKKSTLKNPPPMISSS
eukprot:c13394_g1_i1.p1 GENE.c13394_g1_i1~~c13394_g1_i1.p1  ORF type:complete len:363 (+),score=129.58 c13394_g1_i1:523-1611(+)